MHELHTALFRPLLPPGCDLCGIRNPEDCARPFALNTKGYTTRPDDPDVIVSWPSCPHKYDALRAFAGDAVPLDQHVQYAYEQGVHRSKYLGAGGHRLIREWLRTKDTPRVLLENKAYEDAKRK